MVKQLALNSQVRPIFDSVQDCVLYASQNTVSECVGTRLGSHSVAAGSCISRSFVSLAMASTVHARRHFTEFRAKSGLHQAT